MADLLDDLADPTRVAILHGIRHAGELSPRGLPTTTQRTTAALADTAASSSTGPSRAGALAR